MACLGVAFVTVQIRSRRNNSDTETERGRSILVGQASRAVE
jgi:hypothetical protein